MIRVKLGFERTKSETWDSSTVSTRTIFSVIFILFFAASVYHITFFLHFVCWNAVADTSQSQIIQKANFRTIQMLTFTYIAAVLIGLIVIPRWAWLLLPSHQPQLCPDIKKRISCLWSNHHSFQLGASKDSLWYFLLNWECKFFAPAWSLYLGGWSHRCSLRSRDCVVSLSTSKNRESHEDTVESSLVTRLRSTILFQSFDSHYSSCSVFNNHSRR